jgi:hypothetical protein
MEYVVKFTYKYSGGIRMSNVLKWSGYFAIITGVVIAIYIISSLKVIDISSVDFLAEASPNPYRWLYAGFVLAVTLPTGLMAVTISNYIESKSDDYKYDAKQRREEMNRTDFMSRH